jgi:hypothetical protein
MFSHYAHYVQPLLSILIHVFGTTLEEVQIYTIAIHLTSHQYNNNPLYMSHLSPFFLHQVIYIYMCVCVCVCVCVCWRGEHHTN